MSQTPLPGDSHPLDVCNSGEDIKCGRRFVTLYLSQVPLVRNYRAFGTGHGSLLMAFLSLKPEQILASVFAQ